MARQPPQAIDLACGFQSGLCSGIRSSVVRVVFTFVVKLH